jgi:hypothetical protein
MSEVLTTLTVDAATGETTQRELNAEEITQINTLQIEAEARQIETQAKVQARESALAKLAELGLTAEEIAAL